MPQEVIFIRTPNGLRGRIRRFYHDDEGQVIAVDVQFRGEAVVHYGVNGHEPPGIDYSTRYFTTRNRTE